MMYRLPQPTTPPPSQDVVREAGPAKYAAFAWETGQVILEVTVRPVSDSLYKLGVTLGNYVFQTANSRPQPVRPPRPQPVELSSIIPTATITDNLRRLLSGEYRFDANERIPELDKLEQFIDKQIEQEDMAVISQESFLISLLDAYRSYYLNFKVVWVNSILRQLADPENKQLILNNLKYNLPKGEWIDSQIEMLNGYLIHPKNYNDEITEIVSDIFDEVFKKNDVNKKMIEILSKLADNVPITTFQKLAETKSNLMVMMRLVLQSHEKSSVFLSEMARYLNSKQEL